MALVNSAFTVNVTPGAMPPIVHVSEYDTGRTYTVTINGENGGAFVIPTGATATIEGTLNGEIGFSTTATIANNTVTFALTESMTARSGKAWCKIKLTLNNEPIQTCAFVLAVDRAGVEADTVIGAPGFEEQIQDAVDDWLDEHGGGSGLTDSIKSALLACFQNVAWVTSQGQTYYQALYDALYPAAPPAILSSITAAFSQGGHTVYDTDSLDSLKPYLTVTAHYSNGTSQTVTAYTLSGTLAVGTSTITVSYGGKTTVFNVTVSEDNRAFNMNYPFSDITLTDGYINDSGDITAASGNKVYNEFVPAVGFCIVDNNGSVYSIGQSNSLRIAEYDSSRGFISRSYIQNAKVIIGSNNPSYIKMGFTNSDVVLANADRLVALNVLDTTICNIQNKTIDTEGNVADMAGQSISDYLPIRDGYVVAWVQNDTDTLLVAFFNANKEMISRHGIVAQNTNGLMSALSVPSGSAYIRFRFPTQPVNECYVSYVR